MSTLEKIAERFQIPFLSKLESLTQDGWAANSHSCGIEYREKDKSGVLVLYVFVSVIFFIDHRLEDWDKILVDSLDYLESA
ncbi:MAG TPA: hypothetical protein VMW10_11335 [Alphaproteobacteria bacterium]|nr:hypothetical protein [Alphaproteobacteria bacterium]